MTIDTAALHDGLDSIHACHPVRGKYYIDMFVEAMYLSEEELLSWVKQNWENYAYRHIHGLLTLSLSSVMNSRRLKDALLMLDSLYETKDIKDNCFYNLFSNKTNNKSK